jgi:hypothetical protein
MSDLTADVLEWLRAKAARQRYITREQTDILMTYADGETIANISRKTGMGETTVRARLSSLGLLTRRNKSSGSHTIPWNSPLRCKCCGILLEFADYQENGLCDWCYENPRKVAEKCKDIEQAIIELDNALTIHEEAVQAVEGRG